MYIEHTIQKDLQQELISHFEKGYLLHLSTYLSSNTMIVYKLYHPQTNEEVEITITRLKNAPHSISKYALMVNETTVKEYNVIHKYTHKAQNNYVLITDVERYERVKQERLNRRHWSRPFSQTVTVPKGFAKKIRHHRGFAQVTDNNLLIVKTRDHAYKVIRTDRDSRPTLVYFEGEVTPR